MKYFCENCTTNRLIISGLDVTPVEVTNGIRYSQDKYSTSHEEADVTMVSLIHFLVNEGKQIFQVLWDDTNLFALLLHYFQGLISRCQVFMVPLNETPKIISIEGTFLKHKLLVPNLQAAHALSGCDTVGKTTVLNTLQKESITLKDAGGSDVKRSLAQCTCFVKALYGLSSNQSIEKAWYERYCQRIASNSKFKTASAALQCLPPTPAAMEQNIKRAHFKIAT